MIPCLCIPGNGCKRESGRAWRGIGFPSAGGVTRGEATLFAKGLCEGRRFMSEGPERQREGLTGASRGSLCRGTQRRGERKKVIVKCKLRSQGKNFYWNSGNVYVRRSEHCLLNQPHSITGSTPCCQCTGKNLMTKIKKMQRIKLRFCFYLIKKKWKCCWNMCSIWIYTNKLRIYESLWKLSLFN